MKVDSKELIADKPVRQVRDYLRKVQNGAFFKSHYLDVLGDAAVAELVKRGMIEQHPHHPACWEVTESGRALAMTRFVKRINRKKADDLLVGVLARVEAVNADPDLAETITRVVVFGSYITDTDDLGDLDVALGYERRPYTGSWLDVVERRVEATGADSLRNNFAQFLLWPHEEVCRRIKARLPHISIHTIEEVESQGYPHRQVYPSRESCPQ